MNEDTRLGHSKGTILLTSLPFNKRPFCLNHFELCNVKRVGNSRDSTKHNAFPRSQSISILLYTKSQRNEKIERTSYENT